jgi:hypothetical protein
MKPAIASIATTLAGLGLAVVIATTALAADKKVSKKEGLKAFGTIQTVLQHPRCQNCHIPGDAPLQFDDGRPHMQNVKRGTDGKGMPGMHCSTCHTEANLPAGYDQHAPPGAPNWHLPPEDKKMVFINLPAGELCRILKTGETNGGKDLNALVEHVAHDKLVLWGWNPGPGRAPVSVPHDEFVSQFKTWVAAGAPCPAK